MMAHSQLQLNSAFTVWTCMNCVCAGVHTCVITHLNVALCVFLSSRVNYMRHDVKDRSVKTLLAPLSSYHGDSPANSWLFLNSSATLICVICIDLVPFGNFFNERHFRFKALEVILFVSCWWLICSLLLWLLNVLNKVVNNCMLAESPLAMHVWTYEFTKNFDSCLFSIQSVCLYH